MHNTGIYLTLLILLCLCLCSNYTPSGISPGKIPSHPSHSAVLIAADLQVRTRANFPAKDSESDGKIAGCTGRGVKVWGVGGVLPQCTQAAPETGQVEGSGPASAQWYLMLLLRGCECALTTSPRWTPLTRDMNSDKLSRRSSFHACKIRFWNVKPTQENWSVNVEDDHFLQCFLLTSIRLCFSFSKQTIAQKQRAVNKGDDYTCAWIISVNKHTVTLMPSDKHSEIHTLTVMITVTTAPGLRCFCFEDMFHFGTCKVHVTTLWLKAVITQRQDLCRIIRGWHRSTWTNRYRIQHED